MVELLVVVLIIGILSAIAIPAFLNQRKAANDAMLKNDLRTATTSAHIFLTKNQDAPKVDLNEIKKLMSKTPAVRLTFTGTKDDFCVESQHLAGSENGNWIYVSKTGQTQRGNQNAFSCSNYGANTSDTHVVWDAVA